MRNSTVQPFRGLRAFTLVELLVVVAIIGILIAMLAPAISKSRQSAQMTVCRSNLRQISLASRMYANDFDDSYPDFFTLGGAFFRRGIGQTNPDDPFSVPERYGLAAVFGDQKYVPKTGPLWICPSSPDKFQAYGNTYVNALSVPTSSGKRGASKRENVFWVWDNHANLPYFTGVRRGRSDSNPTLNPANWIFPHQYKVKSSRGAINVLFVDGHVGSAIYLVDPMFRTVVVRGE